MSVAVSYHITFKYYSDQLVVCLIHTYCGKSDTIVIVTSSHCLLKFFTEKWQQITPLMFRISNLHFDLERERRSSVLCTSSNREKLESIAEECGCCAELAQK